MSTIQSFRASVDKQKICEKSIWEAISDAEKALQMSISSMKALSSDQPVEVMKIVWILPGLLQL